MKNLAGNWEIAPVYTHESPEYFAVTSGINGNFNGDSGTIYRTVINPTGVAGTGSDVYGLDAKGNKILPTASATAINAVVAWVAVNPNARYIRAASGAFANAGRNTEPTRPIDDVDLTLLKRFNITERLHFELAGQAFNALNHPQFIPGSINNTARINTSSLTSFVTVTNSNFNNPEKFFASNARTIQFFAKFRW